MSAFVKIKAIKHSLSSSESKLATFTLDSPNAVRDLSSQELANVVGVSQSSVVKFAQKLGYKGYPAFKLAVIDALNRETPNTQLHGKITLNDGFEQMADKLLSSKISVLNETRNLNELVEFEKAVEIIKNAKRILICGVGGSGLVSKDFSFKLQKLGMMAIAEADGHVQLALAATFNESDVVVAISESGATREIVNVVNQAKDNHAKVISITKYGTTPVSEPADVQLYSVAEEASARLSSILARTAQELIIDMLFIALTQASRPGRKLLEKTNEIVSQFRRGGSGTPGS
ncbi:MAG: MurR/RpiR family transcriptional regulator [Alteromonadaceae bacterium TMED7]|nr:RpiR family transcriptional regulator [Alteromonadaceae bacterium]MCP4864106.1 MurR/RpiR family transcriptional regulator [Alteromonas sp.]RPH14681.1 MAG: MurR/RpiR family transcriptional regulator [Alteromonadaceae bacterium TMED7]|tara:strand:+ start:803 stop:1669 length:867 start_codon:yes stop_codon:yes gene_type:complete